MNFWISNRFSNGNTVEAPTAAAPAAEQPQVEQPPVEQPTEETVVAEAVTAEAKPDFYYIALPNNAERSMTVTVEGPQPPAVDFPPPDPLSSTALEEALHRKVSDANLEIIEATTAAEPEPTVESEPAAPVKSGSDISWFTLLVSLAFGSAVFLLKHAYVTLVTLLTYVDTDIKAKYITSK